MFVHMCQYKYIFSLGPSKLSWHTEYIKDFFQFSHEYPGGMSVPNLQHTIQALIITSANF